MAVPKKRSSKARRRRRELVNSVFKEPELFRSAGSGAVVRRHFIDLASGEYRGQQIISAVEKVKSKK